MVKAYVAPYRGAPAIHINGQPVEPFMLFGRIDTEDAAHLDVFYREIARAAKSGVHIYTFFLYLDPDLTVLGKIVAHGYPSAGAVAGKAEVMDICGGGMGTKPYLGGTLAANPISCCACYHAIRLMEENDAVARSAAFADRLVEELNALFATRPDLPFFLYNFGPIIHYVTTGFFAVDINGPQAMEIFSRKDIAEEYQMVASSEGVNSLAGTRMYTCMQHDDAALQKTLQTWEHIMSLIPRA